jgi:hypothetical protein
VHTLFHEPGSYGVEDGHVSVGSLE